MCRRLTQSTCAAHDVYDLTLRFKEMQVTGVAIVDINSKTLLDFRSCTLDDPHTHKWLNEALAAHAAPALLPVPSEEPMPPAPTADASELRAGQVQDKAPIKSEDTSAYMVTTPPQSNKGGRKKK